MNDIIPINGTSTGERKRCLHMQRLQMESLEFELTLNAPADIVNIWFTQESIQIQEAGGATLRAVPLAAIDSDPDAPMITRQYFFAPVGAIVAYTGNCVVIGAYAMPNGGAMGLYERLP